MLKARCFFNISKIREIQGFLLFPPIFPHHVEKEKCAQTERLRLFFSATDG